MNDRLSRSSNHLYIFLQGECIDKNNNEMVIVCEYS